MQFIVGLSQQRLFSTASFCSLSYKYGTDKTIQFGQDRQQHAFRSQILTHASHLRSLNRPVRMALDFAHLGGISLSQSGCTPKSVLMVITYRYINK